MAKKTTPPLKALVAGPNGDIFELEGFAAVGAMGSSLVMLTEKDTIPMPFGGELMFLPDRIPVLFNLEKDCFEKLEYNPYDHSEKIFPVSVFNSPGYVNNCFAAYEENKDASLLPLFSYGAAGWLNKGFRSSAMQVDAEPRQDLRQMPQEKIMKGVHNIRKLMPENRLRAHIENCALRYGCPAAKNFFLQRYEAPLPTSGNCNARCLGCISLQKDTDVASPQKRISFTPTPEEIAEVALFHIKNVTKSVVSFGQGCEGDPLTAHSVILPAVKQIRRLTDRGTIHMNTNGSRPDILENLLDAGIDSIRISMNSVRKSCYNGYFRPVSYAFENVLDSFNVAAKKGKFISVNYLNCPGITDTPEESRAFFKFLSKYPVNMIQWRNLNFDPKKYCEKMSETAVHGDPMGMDHLISIVKKRFPGVKHGYFNPPRQHFTT